MSTSSNPARDVVAFHRPYRRIGVEKGDERQVVGVDHRHREVLLNDGKGGKVSWKPAEIGGRRGGSEVYWADEIELRAGDRIRWTRNDAGLGLVNSRTAEVLSVADGRVTFQLEDGKKLELGRGDPQLRHLDHAWASTVHTFQGRTVDNVIAAMEAGHPHLTTQKRFYVEISRAGRKSFAGSSSRAASSRTWPRRMRRAMKCPPVTSARTSGSGRPCSTTMRSPT